MKTEIKHTIRLLVVILFCLSLQGCTEAFRRDFARGMQMQADMRRQNQIESDRRTQLEYQRRSMVAAETVARNSAPRYY